jgi:3-oxoacyl-(acyl-carrier-protein) synthase
VKSRVQISGVGAICANGLNAQDIFQSCLRGRSTVGANGLSEISPEVFAELKLSTPAELNKSKCTILGYQTFSQAFQDSQWTSEKLKDCGFIFATTTGQIDLWEKVLNQYDSPQVTNEDCLKAALHQPLGAALFELAQFFGVRGPVAQISSSCSASLQAIAMGLMWVQSGKVDRCIVGSTEINNDLTRVGFSSLRLLSTSVSTPFAQNRTGINLGEAGAFLFLERMDVASNPGWGFVAGSGLSSDAFHPTSPHPEGRGSYLAMEKALSSAGIESQDIDWIYAHGTGSPANDLAEAFAINQLFPHKPFVTSTKSLHGHTLGACGALESVLGLLAMKAGVVIPNFNLPQVDSQINLNLPIQPTEKNFKQFLKNSLGFGGINVSVIFSRGDS